MTVVVGETSADLRNFGTDFTLAFDSLPTGGTLRVPANVTVTDTITVPAGKHLWVEPGALITVNHAGVGVNFERRTASLPAHSRLALLKSAPRWITGEDATSVGVQFNEGLYDSDVWLTRVHGFTTGVRFYAPDPSYGMSYNRIHLGWIVDNKVNLHLDQSNGGWVNENQFIGGRLAHSTSSPDQAPGSAEVLCYGNGNLFLGVCMEGARAERSIVCNNTYNQWIGCRFEDAAPAEFTAGSYHNAIVLGYGVLGQRGANDEPRTLEVFDYGEGNLFLGYRSIAIDTYTNAFGGMGAPIEIRTEYDSQAGLRNYMANGDIGVELVSRTLRIRDSGGTLRDITVSAAGKLLIDGAVVGTQT